jgi:hypothetical protein
LRRGEETCSLLVPPQPRRLLHCAGRSNHTAPVEMTDCSCPDM